MCAYSWNPGALRSRADGAGEPSAARDPNALGRGREPWRGVLLGSLPLSASVPELTTGPGTSCPLPSAPAALVGLPPSGRLASLVPGWRGAFDSLAGSHAVEPTP